MMNETEEAIAKAAEEAAIKAKADALQSEEMRRKGAVQRIANVDVNGVEHLLWLKRPSRMAVGVSLATIDTNVIEGCEVIFNDAVMREESDVDYFQQDEIFYGIIADLQRLVRVKKSTSMTL